jgi:hypothetical protein
MLCISGLGNLNILSGDGNDAILIKQSRGNIYIHAGAGNDTIQIDSVGGNVTDVLGGTGNDRLLLDGRDPNSTIIRNTMNGTRIDWNGGEGDDMVEMYFVSAGSTNLNIIGDADGTNEVIANCADLPCTILSRQTFLANIHDPGLSNSTVERISVDETASITSLILHLNSGENSVSFDDTFAEIEVFGGNETDSFSVGQVYNDVSSASSNLAHQSNS